MAGSVNKVILIGNLGKDPEVRYLESGVALAKFPMATTESYKDKNTGERVEQTEWHNIILWRGLAEVAEKYLKKGNQVYIEGKLRTRSWEDQDGNKKYMTEVIADNMTMLGSKRDNSGDETASVQPQSEQPGKETPSVEVQKETPSVEAQKPAEDTAVFKDDPADDLPF